MRETTNMMIKCGKCGGLGKTYAGGYVYKACDCKNGFVEIVEETKIAEEPKYDDKKKSKK